MLVSNPPHPGVELQIDSHSAIVLSLGLWQSHKLPFGHLAPPRHLPNATVYSLTGSWVGVAVGVAEGCSVGAGVGVTDGLLVVGGSVVGVSVGVREGVEVGASDPAFNIIICAV